MFLEKHLYSLKNGIFLSESKRGGGIEEYRFNNEGKTSNAAKKNGIKVEVAYVFNHLFSRFDKQFFEEG